MKSAFDQIKAGLEDAQAFVRGDAERGVAHTLPVEPVDVVHIRKKVAMSQAEFSQTFGFPLSTLRKWEQGRRRPTGAANVLLRIIEKAPEEILSMVTGRAQ